MKMIPFKTLAAVALLSVFGSLSCFSGGYSGRAEPVTVGMESTAVNSVIYIAKDQGYFEANGLVLTIKDDYPSGAAAAEGMLKGEVDIATTAELLVVRLGFARERILTLTSIDRFMHMKLIARKDRGIQDVSGLKGKRIGLPLKTAAEFMLGRFLDLNGISKNQVTLHDVPASKAADALISGEADAVVTWQPNVIAIQDKVGDTVSVWDVQSGQPIYCAVVTTGDWAGSHPDLVERFLKSLAQAEDYLARNPGKARDIVQRRLSYDDRYVETIWPEHQFSLRLDQSLVVAMEDQARWMIANNLTTEKQVPNFLDYIYEDGLKAVKPEAVSIIR